METEDLSMHRVEAGPTRQQRAHIRFSELIVSGHRTWCDRQKVSMDDMDVHTQWVIVLGIVHTAL